jgi:hypothetical protein
MDWNLVGRLSLLGLALGAVTAFVVPPAVETWLWLAIIALSAYAIARSKVPRPFAHRFAMAVLAIVWHTLVHVLFFEHFARVNAEYVESIRKLPLDPRITLLLIGPVVGTFSGVVVGIFAVIAARFVRRGRSIHESDPAA